MWQFLVQNRLWAFFKPITHFADICFIYLQMQKLISSKSLLCCFGPPRAVPREDPAPSSVFGKITRKFWRQGKPLDCPPICSGWRGVCWDSKLHVHGIRKEIPMSKGYSGDRCSLSFRNPIHVTLRPTWKRNTWGSGVKFVPWKLQSACVWILLRFNVWLLWWMPRGSP